MIETEVEILKKEVQDIKQIHLRLDTAIGKISDVSNSINRMLWFMKRNFLDKKKHKTI